MPVWLMPILLKLVLPEVLNLLVQTGILTKMQADLVIDWEGLKQTLSNLKTYPDYDIKKNDPFDMSPDINTIPSFKSGGDNP